MLTKIRGKKYKGRRKEKGERGLLPFCDGPV
jgi:hypothetical protein